MGRHRKQPATQVRRGSVIALTGMVPAGFAAVTAGASAVNTAEFMIMPLAHGDPAAQPAANAQPDELMHMAHQPAPPVVKSVSLAEDRAAADLPAAPGGIPGVANTAYHHAQDVLAEENPDCHMSWSILAGIGQVESHHAYGKLDAEGYPIKPVYGPVLNGTLAGNIAVRETDGGALDGMDSYARAVGPMQFLPETYRKYAADGRDSGVSDPQNIYDAALTAGKYLCSGGLDMNSEAQRTKAIMRYNNSMAYVMNVMAWESKYRDAAAAAAPVPAAPAPATTVGARM
ncbi:lytic transglycosylase domain-containing protein [Nocardia stercoris]|uniref:Lytic transglycosylase n=1 Tax=Nocardia stercoris TaxID=2483361 RepID=A0A3M2LDX1_9NOCA|nr:lytic murein transglycosylase [Nocardia stercoris]RMI35739.1 lytic transglycosylase [Nocardia stercoris]